MATVNEEILPVLGSYVEERKFVSTNEERNRRCIADQPTPPCKNLNIVRKFSLGPKVKKNITYTLIAAFYLLGGVEYGIVLPSLWPFLQNRFDIKNSGAFFGMILSALSVPSFIASPFIGTIVDSLPSARIFLILGCACSAFGNALYFIALNKWFLLIGRILCGAGWACRPALLADITRSTTPEERTGILTILMMFPEIGHFLGPAINVVLVKFDFWIFDRIHIDRYTACGFVSCVMFLFELTLGFFFYFNLQEIRALEMESYDICSGKSTNLNDNSEDVERSHHEKLDAEKNNGSSESIFNNLFSLSFLAYIQHQIIVSLCLVFIANFGIATLETVSFPLMDFLFEWDVVLNSFFSSVACVLIISTLFALHFVSKRISDRSILLVSQIFGFLSIFYLMMINGQAMRHSHYIIYKATEREKTLWRSSIILGYAFFCVSIPTTGVIATSLLSKMFKQEKQGIGQGAQLSMTSMANILGHLWTGSMVWKSTDAMFSIELFLHFVTFILFICSWRRLDPVNDLKN